MKKIHRINELRRRLERAKIALNDIPNTKEQLKKRSDAYWRWKDIDMELAAERERYGDWD